MTYAYKTFYARGRGSKEPPLIVEVSHDDCKCPSRVTIIKGRTRNVLTIPYVNPMNGKNVNIVNSPNGDRFLLFVTGTFAENIIILNVDKLEYNIAHFNNLSGIEIGEIHAEDSYIGVIATGNLFDQKERKINYNTAIAFSCKSQDEVPTMLRSGTYSVISEGHEYDIFIDVDINRTTNNSITEDEKSGYNNDDEMEVLSVPKNAFFKEFRELMDKISSHVLSYGASINMIPNDRIKVCSFIDSINEVIEKYNKK